MEQKCLREYNIYCQDTRFSFGETVQVKCPEEKDESQLRSELHDWIFRIVQEQNDYLIFDAIDSYSPPKHGYYNLTQLTEEMYSAAKRFLEKESSGVHISAKLVNNRDSLAEDAKQYDFSLSRIFDEIIDERSIDECVSSDAGSIIEKSLLYFEKNSCWQYGLIRDTEILCNPSQWPRPTICDNEVKWIENGRELLPIIWFGLLGESPLPRWSLCQSTTANDIDFWFKDIWDYQLEMLGDDFDQIFLVWYLYECGYASMDIDEIRKKCPILLEKAMTPHTLKDRITTFFLSQANKAD